MKMVILRPATIRFILTPDLLMFLLVLLYLQIKILGFTTSFTGILKFEQYDRWLILNLDLHRTSNEPLNILQHLLRFYKGNVPLKHREILNVVHLVKLSEAQPREEDSTEKPLSIKADVTMYDIVEPFNQIFRVPAGNIAGLKRRLIFLAENLEKCVRTDESTDVTQELVKRGTIKRICDAATAMREPFTIRGKDDLSCCISVVQVGIFQITCMLLNITEFN